MQLTVIMCTSHSCKAAILYFRLIFVTEVFLFSVKFGQLTSISQSVQRTVEHRQGTVRHKRHRWPSTASRPISSHLDHVLPLDLDRLG